MQEKYKTIEALNQLQRQAGADPEIKDLVCAYARACLDAGREPVMHDEDPSPSLRDDKHLKWIVERNPDIDLRLLDFFGRYSRTIGARRIPVIFNNEHLARRLHMSVADMNGMLFNRRQLYRSFEVPKSDGRSRTIHAPCGRLKRIQSWVVRSILDHRKPHRSARAYRKGMSIADNARPHIGRQVVLRIDLEDFFPSITHRQVRKVFESFGYPYRVAIALANICTLDDSLPQGGVTSPAVSNFVAGNLDRRLAGLARRMKFRYTRYADDLILSSNNPRLPELIPWIKEIIVDEGFRVNEKKVRVMRKSRRQTVTGIVVNETMNIPRSERRRLRAMEHRRRTMGDDAVEDHVSRNTAADPVRVLEGKLSFLHMINPACACRIARIDSSPRQEPGGGYV